MSQGGARERMTRRTFVRALSAVGGSMVLVVTASGCAMLGGLYGPSSSQTEEAVETSTVAMRNISFQPAVIRVAPGTTVTWVNQDQVDHTVTSQPADRFDSGNVAPGGRFEFTFDQPGTYDYVCTIHPGMSGRVIVEETSSM